MGITRHTLLCVGVALLALTGAARAERSAAIARASREAAEDLARVRDLPISDSPLLAPDVKDPVFSFMVGLLDHDLCGAVCAPHFEQVIAAVGRPSRIPHDVIRSVRRGRGRRGHNWVEARFTEALKLPVPYSILGYHPGSLVSSPNVLFAEWHLARTHVGNPLGPSPPYFELKDLTLWGLIEGEILLDIDGWLDFMLGGKLDDTRIIGLAIFRFRGVRYALALGFNDEGRGRSGVLDVAEDEIRYPSPTELKVIARDLRGRIVTRLAKQGIAAWQPPSQPG